MNSLQIGLIAIGAVVVAVLFLLNWWQSKRAKRLTDTGSTAKSQATPASPAMEVNTVAAPATDRRPIAAPYERTEPSFDKQTVDVWATDARAVPVDPDAMTPVTVAPIESATPVAFEAAPPAPPTPPALSPAPTPAPIQRPTQTTPAAAATVPTIRAQSDWPFDERLHVHASFVNLSGGPFDAAPFVNAAGRASGWARLFRQSPWERYQADQVGSVQQLVLALPLASRQGPIEAQDMDAWQFVLSELATAQGCEAHFHGFRDAPHRAAELDSFLAAVDIMPDVYLVKKSGGHWTGTRLRGTLEANGFRLQSDGRFAYHEVESETIIFHAVDGFERPFTPERLRSDAITALRFSIEPVRLAHPLARYDTFRQSLRALSKLLDADLKSSEGELLDDTRFAAIREEVKTAMEAIANAGIEPGSDTARSLFS